MGTVGMQSTEENVYLVTIHINHSMTTFKAYLVTIHINHSMTTFKNVVT